MGAMLSIQLTWDEEGRSGYQAVTVNRDGGLTIAGLSAPAVPTSWTEVPPWIMAVAFELKACKERCEAIVSGRKP